MKKITLMIFALCFVFAAQAQEQTLEATSLSEVTELGYEFDPIQAQELGSAVITSQTRGGTATFTARVDFQNACSNTLVLEDFAGGPGGITVCGAVSSAGDACFAPGEIQPGIVIESSTAGDVVYVPAGTFSNVDPVVGSNTFVDFTIINFPNDDVTSAGFDLHSLLAGSNVEVRIFGTGGLIDTFNVDVTSTGPVFFGFIAEETVVSVELEDLGLGNAEVIAMIEFGDCGDNDLCEDAFPIACGETVSGSTVGATIDTGTALDCVNDGGGPSPVTISAPGIWYVYDDTDGLAKNINLSTCNDANFDTKISVYTGDCTDLSCFTAVDDAAGCAGFTTELDFISDGNTTYYILVHGFGAATGDFNLTMTCTILPPPNDMIANSIDVDEIGTPYTDPNVATLAATLEAGNPTDCIIDGANGVWYNLVAEGNGTGTAEVVSPAGTTAVIWFTAPDESAVETDLTLVPGGDNQCLPSTSSTINTVQGQAYYIFVVNTDGPTDINIDGVNLGVDDTVIVGFSYQPNPVNNTLELNSKELIEDVQIFNILGQKVIDLNVDATNSMIDVSGLQTGTYIMKASINGQIGTYKIIKE